jgi:hypothetical protein
VNLYNFEIQSPIGSVFFRVLASSRAEAVAKANNDFEEGTESGMFYIGSNTGEGSFTFSEDFRVADSHIIEESDIEPIPQQALVALQERAYENGNVSRTIEDWAQDLLQKGRGSWVKAFMTGDGSESRMYGTLFVRGHLTNQRTWYFGIECFIYPGPYAQGLKEDGSGALYKVILRAAQSQVGDKELGAMLDAYEAKFAQLVYALREADPVDGLPLSDIEKTIGGIEGFFDTTSYNK